MEKGRGASSNPTNRFEKYEIEKHFFNDCYYDGDEKLNTAYIPTFPKTIINKIDSPDVPFQYSINPYQGCEHGCIYCFARPTHNYWGYSSGVDFEQKILVKENAAELLEKKLRSKHWKANPIALSGNTDCYQPIERKLKITRSLLKLFYKYRHPVTIITKNHLILRDLDILEQLNRENLVHVAVSLTTLDVELQRNMEPRTSTPEKRLEIIRALSDHGIPVVGMMAPVIPGLTEHEILRIAEACATCGARDFRYAIIRLNFDLDGLFEEWLSNHLPDRKEKVLNRIRSVRKGKLSATITENRHKGFGSVAEIIGQQAALARKIYFHDASKVILNTQLHEKYKSSQLTLF